MRIEAVNERAWCGAAPLQLTPRAFSVLRHLVEHAGRLITKDELFAAVWRDTIVSEAALASCIRDVRRALGEASRAPRYIETVHRRGFRFIGPTAAAPAAPAAAPVGVPAPAPLVGREAELAWLRQRLDRALGGQRQLVFVTGEPGIGKTALVEAFLARIGDGEGIRIGRGQCVEQYGAGEAYLPVLEALGRLGRALDGAALVKILKQHAPTWLAQLPGLLTDADVEAVQHRAEGATRARMLRELVEALDILAAEGPLVLLLEDLHWSDSATIDLLVMLARRRDASRLMVVGTHRPADLAARAHPLRAAQQELQWHGHCDALPLELLSAAAVGEYVVRRFPAARIPPDFSRVLHRNTEGNPLFLVNTIGHLIDQGHLREVEGQWALAVPLAVIARAAPESLWQAVERQVEQLTQPEQAMLAVASVAGVEFSAAVAAADGIDPREGEERCQGLARRGQFLRLVGVAEWPDGTVAGRYAFIHALYQGALYARISVGHRVGLHLRTGQRLERAYGPRSGEIAGELAVHFEEGRDFDRGLRYRRQAAEHALRQHGYREAADHATRALELLGAWPESAERIEDELLLRSMLATALAASEGFAAPEVARTHARARELCAHLDDTARLFPVLLGLGRFHHIRGEVQRARDGGARLLHLAEVTADPAVALAAHNGLGIMAFYAGELDVALRHLEGGLALYDPVEHGPNRSGAFRGGQDPGVSCAVYAAWALQLLGYPARAAARMREALATARSLAHPFSVAYACHFAAGLHQHRREPSAARALEDEADAHSNEHGFSLFLMVGAIHRGWLLAQEGRAVEGLARMRDGLAASHAIGMELRRPAFLALAAEVCLEDGRTDEGLSAVAEGFEGGQRTGQRYWDAELHCLRGRLILQGRRERLAEAAAEASFGEALAVARRQRAKAFELRAGSHLARLWARQGKRAPAHALLTEICGWFTEGFDTADLRDARALLAELEPSAR